MTELASHQQADTLLDVRAAARLVKRSPETIRRWIWSGRLPARRRGNRLLVSRDDLTALVRQRGNDPALSLSEWAAAARLALDQSACRARGSAADLILEDRRHRSGGDFA
ncbi:MAG: helix-turn-helix domain-containing protein [Actinomycetota bacterium]